MLLSQKLAGFSKGQADKLRKAMGKKKKKIIDEMYPKFLEGCLANGHPEDKIKKIWSDWEFFASYAFNKSHSTCYAFIAFQTAYLKTHYPSEFMTAVLNHNKSDISKLNFFLRECKRMKIPVFGPDINLSGINFTVNLKGEIRFGLSALKGLGAGPAEEIIKERDNGSFSDIIDMTKRVNLRAINKKTMESLAYAGAFDSFGKYRSQYFTPSDKYETFIEHAIRFGSTYQNQKESSQSSLFGEMSDDLLSIPAMPPSDPWMKTYMLDKEKEVTGIYISGHPLDDYKMELENYVNCGLNQVEKMVDAELKLAGIVTQAFHGVSQKNGLGYARITIQDYVGSFEMGVYNEDYEKYKNLLAVGQVLYIVGKNQRYRGSDRVFFKLFDVRLLASVSEDLTRSLTLRIPVMSLTDNMIHDLRELCQNNPGDHTLNMKIVEERVAMDFSVSAFKVDINSGFIDRIRKMGLSYKLN